MVSNNKITIEMVEGQINNTVLYKPVQTLNGVRWEPYSVQAYFDKDFNLIKTTVEKLDGGAIVTG